MSKDERLIIKYGVPGILQIFLTVYSVAHIILVMEYIEDLEDLTELRKLKKVSAKEKTISLELAKKEMGI